MKADLHIHSKYSGIGGYWKLRYYDSVEEPRNILKYAKKKNIDIIAITDHNTIRGGIEGKKLVRNLELRLLLALK